MRRLLIAGLVCWMAVSAAACGRPEDGGAATLNPQPLASQTGQAGAYAGTYVDTYGTTDVYSELELDYQGDGVYQTMIGIYRLTTLDGTAREEGDRLLFQSDSESPAVQGEITFGEEGAVFTVTASEFSYLAPGDEIAFPTKQ